MKICLRPAPDQLSETSSIGHVVKAQRRYLPDYGVEFVDDPREADLCVGHTDYYDLPRLDVLHSHGIYWTGDIDSGEYSGYHVNANKHVIEAIRMAHTVTVPGRWVAMPFKRDMRINPIVIGHGIDFDQWLPVDEPNDYALWNKTRAMDICMPDAPYELAKRGVPVVTTFGPSGVQWPQNLMVIGKQERVAMRQFISQASVYLSTVKETFGIGTLEAMACGVPVVGWDYGGTSDIVTNGHDGILVKPGDYDALYKAVLEAQQKRATLGRNARETACRYDWKNVIGAYAELYSAVFDYIRREKHGVSIVITNHNYAAYVGQAITSALQQTRLPDEVIIVDDGSTDDSLRVIRETLSAAQPAVKHQVIAQANQGVAAARTAGIAAATQPYICCLDADDKLAPRFLETLWPAIDARRDMGIVYSGITLFDSEKSWPSDFPPPFDWEGQATPHNPPSNCIPSACLFRKEMWYRAGPHRQEYAPGEDAEFWTRGLAMGFNAERVTTEGLFWYRLHGESASRRLKYKPIDDRLPWMKDKQYPFAAPAKYAPPVRSYSAPKVSVVIPVGTGHAAYVSDAIESLIAQTMREWECIVIDDTLNHDAAFVTRRYPFVTYLGHPTTGHKPVGAGAARNSGIEQAHAPLILFLDADDILAPSALEEMLIAHVNSGGRYIYCDTLKLSRDGTSQMIEASDYEQRIWKDDGLHAVTALIPTAWARGTLFNAALKTWEEGDFYSRLALAGCCGQRLNRPLLIWRDWTGKRHKATKKARQDALQHQATLEGAEMSNCGCGEAAETILAAKAALSGMTVKVEATRQGEIRMEYIGDKWGPITFIGSKGREYRGGIDDEHKFATVLPEDAKRLELSGQWRILK